MFVLIQVFEGVSGRELMPRGWDLSKEIVYFSVCLKLLLLCFIVRVLTFETYFCHSSLAAGIKRASGLSKVVYCTELQPTAMWD